METRTIRRRDLDEDILIDSRTELIPFPASSYFIQELWPEYQLQSWQVNWPLMTGLSRQLTGRWVILLWMELGDNWLAGELSYDDLSLSTVVWQVSYPVMTGLSRQLTGRWVILWWPESVDSWLAGELSCDDRTQSTVDWQVSHPVMTGLSRQLTGRWVILWWLDSVDSSQVIVSN